MHIAKFLQSKVLTQVPLYSYTIKNIVDYLMYRAKFLQKNISRQFNTHTYIYYEIKIFYAYLSIFRICFFKERIIMRSE